MNRNVLPLKIMNTAALLATLVINGLANGLPINGMTTGELSDFYENLFVPAGITFSIWGVIYLLLAAFVVYQFLGGRAAEEQVEKIGWWFTISSVMNCLWIFMWHYRLIALSALVMIGLLASLIRIYFRLGTGKTHAELKDYALVRVPFSVYLGWISVATVANFTALFVDLGWRGQPLPEAFWAMLMVLVAAALGVVFIFTRKDIPYSLVIAWALTGILIKRSASNTSADGPVMWAAGFGIVVIALSIFIMEIRRTHPEKKQA